MSSRRLPIEPLPADLRDRVLLIPGRLADWRAIDSDIDVQHDRLAIAHASQTALQGGREIGCTGHLLTLQPVGLRDLCELDARVSEISVEVLPCLVERTAVEHVARTA